MFTPTVTRTTLSKLQLLENFRLKGLKKIGEGTFASVFAENENTCIKVGARDHYLQYIKHVGINNSCIHVPKISSVEILVNRFDTNSSCRSFYCVRMERLLKFWDICDIQRENAMYRLGIETLNDLKAPWEIKGVTEQVRQFKTLITKAFKNKMNMLDIHSGNVMFRKRDKEFDLVLTDPLA
jgi:hypothetical protein